MDLMDHTAPNASQPLRAIAGGPAWAGTALGDPAGWSHSLRSVTQLVNDAALPMFLIWGPQRILVYNNAFSRIAADRHPAVFGSPVATSWPELWRWDAHVFQTQYEGAILSFQDQHLVAAADAWFDLYYTPVRDDDGAVNGVMCNVVESTRRVKAEQASLARGESLNTLAQTLEQERLAALEVTTRLQEETRSLKNLFEQAPGFMAFTRGPEHVFEFANASYLRLVGRRDLIGRQVRQAFPEVVEQGFIRLLDTVYETGQPYIGKNVPIVLQNAASQPSESLLLDFVYQPMFDADGKVNGIFVEGIDVTERAAVEERLRIAHEAGGVGTFEWFPISDQLIASDTYRALWGVHRDTELSSALLTERVDARDRHLLGSATEKNRLNPLAYAEFRIRRFDTDEVRWLARRGEVLGDGVLTMRRYVGVAFDITERKLVEEALAATERQVRESTQFIRLLLDSTEEGFYSVAPDGSTTLCNRGFLRMLGFTHEEQALGRKLHDVIHHSHADGTPYPREHCPIYLAAQTGESAHVDDEWFYRVDGSRFPVEYRVHPIWRDGVLEGALCTFADISQRIDSINQLRELNETLEHRVIEEIDRRARAEEALHQSQKMEAIGQLTGGVAHDFNNVLHIIGGNLQLLQQHLQGDATAQKRLDTATAAVARGAKLSSQLLAFARRQPLQPIVINLGRLVQNMNDLLRRALGESIEVETTVDDTLWNTLADPSQIENVILNLAINSRDAMDAGGRLRIGLDNVSIDANPANQASQFAATATTAIGDSIPAGEYVLLTVADSGTGMTPDILQKAFEPFFTTKPEGEGTGLGLSMAYGFVKQSHGHIKIQSRPEHGTTIFIYLPRSLEAEAQIAEPASGPVQGGSETILVVEDDPGVQATVVDTLTTLGYHVLKADDGQSAMLMLRSGVQIDLLFTDVVMPGPLRSPELAHQARLCMPGLAVLFTSGYTQDAIVHGGRLDPGVDLLSKPYRRDQLARKIRNSLALHGQARAPAQASSEAGSRTPVQDTIAAGLEAAEVMPEEMQAMAQTPLQTRVAAAALAPAPGGSVNLTAATPESTRPSGDGDPAAGTVAETGETTETAVTATASLQILVVEDNPDLCQLVCELLETFGHVTIAAGSAEEALSRLEGRQPDVLLTDVRLPGMSGIELARKVLALRPSTHVVFASGYGASLTANVGFPAHSLTKPYDIEQLQALLVSLR